MITERFRAMGTSMELLLDAPVSPTAHTALHAARAEIARLEALLSRFRTDSELSHLNRVRRARVGPDLARVLSAALDMRELTGGRFDPTLGGAMVACGYDRSFEEIPHAAGTSRPAPGGGPVSFDAASRAATLGRGVTLDLGAIAKGDAADRACRILSEAGPCLVNAGGDIAVSGPRGDAPWPVGIDEGRIVLDLESGALATSGTDRRRWRRDGREIHHVMDPEMGSSAGTDVLRATAVAATAAAADAFATALVVAGVRDACDLADQWAIPAVVVSRGGDVSFAGGLA